LIASVAFIILRRDPAVRFGGSIPWLALRLHHRPRPGLELSLWRRSASSFDKLLSQIHIFRSSRSRKTRRQLRRATTRKKGAEPEEAIFIGIND
jgi:hypothetical protein